MPPDSLLQRCASHGLTHLAQGKPHEIVTWFGAMQAQEGASARWALGVRCPALTDGGVQQAIHDRTVVRTWALRSTLHLVAAEDVHWLMALIGPVMLARNAARYRAHGLDAQGFEKVGECIRSVLQGGNQLSRAELFTALTRKGIDTVGMRGGSILYRAAMESLLCLASDRGKQTTYALLDEWVPDRQVMARDAALAELACRYFRSHGPATLRDFTWWSGLSVVDARGAISLAEERLSQVDIGDTMSWQARHPVPTAANPAIVHLLPAFDEYFLGYADRTPALAAAHAGRVMTNNGLFRPTILVDGEIVGIWARSVKNGVASIDAQLFRRLTHDEKHAVNLAARRHADFMALRLGGPAL